MPSVIPEEPAVQWALSEQGRMGYSEGNLKGHQGRMGFIEGKLKGQQVAGNWEKKGIIPELRRGGRDGNESPRKQKYTHKGHKPSMRDGMCTLKVE